MKLILNLKSLFKSVLDFVKLILSYINLLVVKHIVYCKVINLVKGLLKIFGVFIFWLDVCVINIRSFFEHLTNRLTHDGILHLAIALQLLFIKAIFIFIKEIIRWYLSIVHWIKIFESFYVHKVIRQMASMGICNLCNLFMYVIYLWWPTHVIPFFYYLTSIPL